MCIRDRLGASTSLVESTLAQKYKQPDHLYGGWRGGPAYYLPVSYTHLDVYKRQALDAATQGFEDALTAEFGDNVKFDFQNAQGDSATCATIANGFVSSGVDLIMANATPALQAAQSATNEIPVLGTSVTEYGVALGLTDFSGKMCIRDSCPSPLRQ